jgi:sec-independent protein translocase protein TatA
MDVGTPELLIILVVVMLVFGGKKLPELARGSGRALRIFKAEVTGLEDEETTGRAASDAADAAPSPAASPAASDSGADADLEARHTAEREALQSRQAAERRAISPED